MITVPAMAAVGLAVALLAIGFVIGYAWVWAWFAGILGDK